MSEGDATPDPTPALTDAQRLAVVQELWDRAGASDRWSPMHSVLASYECEARARCQTDPASIT